MANLSVAVSSWAAVLVARLARMFRATEPLAIELVSGFLGFWWGLWLLLPLWDTFATTASFAFMASVAPEWLWGAVIMIGGGFQVTVVILGNPIWRWRAALGAVATWGLVAGMLATANVGGTGTVTYSIICISQMWACWRITLEAGD